MIGYCVPINPKLASYRLRVALPRKHLGMPHKIGVGDVTFFYKDGSPDLAKRLGPVVYDVVNAHFDRSEYRAMCEIARVITCSSEAMADVIRGITGRDAVVIPDPYENDERAPAVAGGVLWFGHQANLASLMPYADLDPVVLTAADWTLDGEAKALADAGVVLLTGGNPGASANRPIKALRAGRFVVVPQDSPDSWLDLQDYIWIGDVRKGIQWAYDHREEACRRVTLGQQYVRDRFSPRLIGSQWADLFASTSAAGTNRKRAGSVSISR